MTIDKSGWKKFHIGRLFTLETGKGHLNTLSEGDDCVYIGAKKDENGFMTYCARDESMVQKGNCIIFICNGDGSVGYANYMDRDFIGTTDIVAGYNDNLTELSGLFIATVASLERPKYSFARKWKTFLKNTTILLPAINDEPNWKYMEEYMSSIDGDMSSIPDYFLEEGCKKACWYLDNIDTDKFETEYAGKKNNIKVRLTDRRWKKFKISDIFKIYRGKRLKAADHMPGDLSYYSASKENNGITDYISNPLFVDNNAIIFSTFGDAYYVENDFTASDEISILKLKNNLLNRYNGLFLATILHQLQEKFSFGRKAFLSAFVEEKINLPVNDKSQPDYQFMEDYIKSLPFSAKL